MEETKTKRGSMKMKEVETVVEKDETPSTINVLRNERVTVRFVYRKRGSISNPDSPLAGGLANTSTITFTVPRLRSGILKNPLTDVEKNFFENLMGLEKDAMSIYKRDFNYWSSATSGCINNVVLSKRDTILNLNDPNDYIKYKILLCNPDQICPSLQELEDNPKPTYMFVLVSDAAETKALSYKANLKFECYTSYGKYKDNRSILNCIIKLMTGRKPASDIRIELLQSMVTKSLEADTRRFLEITNDPLLEYKALIETAVDKGIIANRNNLYYLRENSMALCDDGKEPRLNTAAKYLANPANQDLRDNIMEKCN